MAKKRGNGEGSISRRKNGGWMTQYAVYTAEGRKRKTLYGKTRAEVAAKLAKALSDREGGLTFDANNMKLDDYLIPNPAEEFSEHHAACGHQW